MKMLQCITKTALAAGRPFFRCARASLGAAALALLLAVGAGAAAQTNRAGQPLPAIRAITPPEDDFFDKELSFHGIPIKANNVVTNKALYAAYDRLATMLGSQPAVISNLVAARVELHIIGKNQVTTDLPEWRHDKGQSLAEYKGLTRDQRTRGMGGRLTSCGEENLLQLKQDRYFGRDICMHEFAHAINDFGMDRAVRTRFEQQYRNSLEKGLWTGSYAASNPGEFFAELTMWYFGTHGDLNMKGPKPENGSGGLRRYDPDAYKLFEEFYSGKLGVALRKFRRNSTGLKD